LLEAHERVKLQRGGTEKKEVVRERRRVRERKKEEEELARSRSNESLLGVMTSILGQRRGE